MALEEGEAFKRTVAEAQRAIAAGHPATLLDVIYPVPLPVTAMVFLDKYGPEEKYDVVQHIPQVRVPLLVMVGTAEAQTMTAFKGLPPLLEKLATELMTFSFASIPGADHAYTHQRAYVWKVVSEWLSTRGTRS